MMKKKKEVKFVYTSREFEENAVGVVDRKSGIALGGEGEKEKNKGEGGGVLWIFNIGHHLGCTDNFQSPARFPNTYLFLKIYDVRLG